MVVEPPSGTSGRPRTVFVTGANGYIGAAVCRAFVGAGWRTFGLVRKPEAVQDLMATEVIPVVGTFNELSFLGSVYEKATVFDAIVSCTENLSGYADHFNEVMLLVKTLAERSKQSGVRSLVLWSSGCKDYGTTEAHGASALVPHTEASPTNPPVLLRQRTESCLRIFDYVDVFDAVLLRPTSLYGRSSSYYGVMLSWVAMEAAAGSRRLKIPANPNNIMHATHVDDCGLAYLAVAEHADRSAIAGKTFNISGHRYETVQEVGEALAKEYGFEEGVEFVFPADAPASFPEGLHLVFNFSQWVSSESIRRTTGWTDLRPLFSENLTVYRWAYEAALARGNTNFTAVEDRVSSIVKGLGSM
ncbi:NAD(P)-binding protein [Trichoderma citrinoviride]|uniref:NAD(P)-binding protein n=1 Tax=Trichoderma citrinoviride TaxID=58853 RepID=A0A2T4AXH0_9HYPO|nr:NAD(P)-binding protein [Trichoderma citrinoviride]PTB61753.1 NAD(P)-binding protein [Trichoderma citrinoviride]